MSEAIEPYFSSSAEVYDLLYSSRNYAGQVRILKSLLEDNAQIPIDSLLDVACGTGLHLQYLNKYYKVEGLDLSADQLSHARIKLPGVRLHQADMTDFDLGKKFDAITCLFSSIGYLQTQEKLEEAVSTMAEHLNPGGVLIIEAWIEDLDFESNFVSLDSASTGDALTVARMGEISKDGIITNMQLHHLVGKNGKINYFVEEHALAMYSDEDYEKAFLKAGLSMSVDRKGLLPANARSIRRLLIGTN